jgi:hypothetical protein
VSPYGIMAVNTVKIHVLHIISILERHVMAINSEEEEIITLEGV